MRTTLNYTTTKLNASSSATPSGSTEPVTGLTIATGTNSGDFVELTDAQAAAVSLVDSTHNKLFTGIFQRVKFSSVTSLAVGQACFWNNAADTTDPYPVTPVYAAGVKNNFAGVVIDPGTTLALPYAWIQVNGRATCLFDSSVSGGAIGDPVGITASANTFAQIAGAFSLYMLGSFVGVSLTAETLSTASLVSIFRGQARY